MNAEEKALNEIIKRAEELMAGWSSTKNRQKAFVLEYIRTGFSNATEAARNAGYSEKTANKQASQLLSGMDKTRHILEVVDELKKMYEERMIELSIADGTEILQYLTSLMRGQQTEQTLRGMGEGYQQIIDIEVSAKDRIKAAELLGKSKTLWTEKLDVSGGVVFISGDDDLED